jgi:E3 ubiquitin-protein ligase UHRF1
MPTAFDKQRDENIRRNRELLFSVGLEKPLIEPKQQPLPRKRGAPAPSRKRKVATDAEEDSESPSKVARMKEDDSISDGPRRSSRNAGRRVDYNAELDRSLAEPLSIKARRERDPTLGDAATPGDRRVHDP